MANNLCEANNSFMSESIEMKIETQYTYVNTVEIDKKNQCNEVIQL